MSKHMWANVVFSKFSRDFTELKGYLPIRPSEMGLLNIVARRRGDLTPMELAEIMAVSKPMIAAHIRSLEKKGYIFKETSGEDKRSFFVRPTDKALLLVREYEEMQTKRVAALEDSLGSEDFDRLVLLLDRAQRVVREMKREQMKENEEGSDINV